MDRGIHGRGLTRVGIDVQIHLLACSDQHSVTATMQSMKQVDPLGVDTKYPCQDVDRLERLRFRCVSDMRLDRVHGATRAPIGIIHTDRAPQHIGRIAKHLHVARIGHVAVVINPLRPDLGFHQPQSGGSIIGGNPRPRSGRMLLIQALFERPQSSASADVVLPQDLLDGHEIVIPKPLQLADGASRGLLLCALDHPIDEPLGQLGRLQFRPGPFQTRPELAQHVPHTGLAAGEMVDEVGAHRGPAQAGAINNGLIELTGCGHTVVHQVQDLAPQRLLQAVGQMPRNLLTDP